MSNPIPLVSTREAAKRLKVSPRHIARLVEHGQLTPAVKTPGIRGAFMFADAEIRKHEELES